MIINRNIDDSQSHVEFISYSGEYPSLCMGVLTLKIDGEEIRFGHDYKNSHWHNDGNYKCFWISGGYTDIGNNEWKIDYEALPEKYRQYANEIDRVFNENVDYGCCGGCL